MNEAMNLPDSDLPFDSRSRVDTKTAARILGLSAATLIRYRREGIGPKYSRLGPRLIRYLKTDLETWVAPDA